MFVGVVLALIYRLMQNNHLGSGARCFISVQDNRHLVFSVFALNLNILCGSPLIVLAQLEQAFETVHFSVYTSIQNIGPASFLIVPILVRTIKIAQSHSTVLFKAIRDGSQSGRSSHVIA